MASTISEYLVKAASYNNASQGFLKKIRTLGDQFSTLHGFKAANVEDSHDGQGETHRSSYSE